MRGFQNTMGTTIVPILIFGGDNYEPKTYKSPKRIERYIQTIQ